MSPKSDSKIDIVVVNWNAGRYLEQCVNSIRSHHSLLVERIFVVDNGSIDGSINFLCDATDVELISLNKNLGFARACNIGAACGEGEFILFLNPDARLQQNSLEVALSQFKGLRGQGVGIVGLALVGDDGSVQRTCAKFPHALNFIAKSFGVCNLMVQTDFHLFEWDHSKTTKVDHVIGAFFLVRRSLFELLQGFDERFFVYLEDLDFSLRAANAGYASMYVTEASAYHKGGGVSERVLAHRLFYSIRSRIQYAFKNFSIISSILVAFSALCIEPFSRSTALVLTGQLREVRNVACAYKMIWGWALRGMR